MYMYTCIAMIKAPPIVSSVPWTTCAPPKLLILASSGQIITITEPTTMLLFFRTVFFFYFLFRNLIDYQHNQSLTFQTNSVLMTACCWLSDKSLIFKKIHVSTSKVFTLTVFIITFCLHIISNTGRGRGK